MDNIFQMMILRKGHFIILTIVILFTYGLLHFLYNEKVGGIVITDGVRCSFKEFHVGNGFALAQCGEKEVKITDNSAIEFMVNTRAPLPCAIKQNGYAECTIPKEH